MSAKSPFKLFDMFFACWSSICFNLNKYGKICYYFNLFIWHNLRPFLPVEVGSHSFPLKPEEAGDNWMFQQMPKLIVIQISQNYEKNVIIRKKLVVGFGTGSRIRPIFSWNWFGVRIWIQVKMKWICKMTNRYKYSVWGCSLWKICIVL